MLQVTVPSVSANTLQTSLFEHFSATPSRKTTQLTTNPTGLQEPRLSDTGQSQRLVYLLARKISQCVYCLF